MAKITTNPLKNIHSVFTYLATYADSLHAHCCKCVFLFSIKNENLHMGREARGQLLHNVEGVSE